MRVAVPTFVLSVIAGWLLGQVFGPDPIAQNHPQEASPAEPTPNDVPRLLAAGRPAAPPPDAFSKRIRRLMRNVVLVPPTVRQPRAEQAARQAAALWRQPPPWPPGVELDMTAVSWRCPTPVPGPDRKRILGYLRTLAQRVAREPIALGASRTVPLIESVGRELDRERDEHLVCYSLRKRSLKVGWSETLQTWPVGARQETAVFDGHIVRQSLFLEHSGADINVSPGDMAFEDGSALTPVTFRRILATLGPYVAALVERGHYVAELEDDTTLRLALPLGHLGGSMRLPFQGHLPPAVVPSRDGLVGILQLRVSLDHGSMPTIIEVRDLKGGLGMQIRAAEFVAVSDGPHVPRILERVSYYGDEVLLHTAKACHSRVRRCSPGPESIDLLHGPPSMMRGTIGRNRSVAVKLDPERPLGPQVYTTVRRELEAQR